MVSQTYNTIFKVVKQEKEVILMKNFNVKIKDARKNKGISQLELAKILGTDQRIVSRYETGKVTPSLDRLVQLAQILDVSLDDLVEFKKIQNKLSEDLNNK